jgi:hypothetical protein
MVKITSDTVDTPRFRGASEMEDGELGASVSSPAHKDFRVRYFSRFESPLQPSVS